MMGAHPLIIPGPALAKVPLYNFYMLLYVICYLARYNVPSIQNISC